MLYYFNYYTKYIYIENYTTFLIYTNENKFKTNLGKNIRCNYF